MVISRGDILACLPPYKPTCRATRRGEVSHCCCHCCHTLLLELTVASSLWRLSRRVWKRWSAVMLSRRLYSRHATPSMLSPALIWKQDMAAQIEQLSKQRDAARNEVDMAQDTARNYYARMVKAEAERSHLQTSMVEASDSPGSFDLLISLRTVIDLCSS